MSNYYAVNNADPLQHHGILGQKWGVRRYQNADGTLTEAGKKHYSKEYEKLNNKFAKSFTPTANKIYMESYKKTNKELEGKEYSDEEFEDLFDKNYNISIYKAMKNNKYYKQAEELCEKYSLDKISDLAADNVQSANEIKERYGL